MYSFGLSDGSWLCEQIGCLKSSGWKPLPGAVDTAVNGLTNVWSIPQLSKKRSYYSKTTTIPFFVILGFGFVKVILGTLETF